MASANGLRVLEESRVFRPPGSEHRGSLPLTFFDAMWLFTDGLVQRLLFYRFPHPTAYFVESVLPALKSSLSLTLQHLYPLAGKLVRSSDSNGNKIEICYSDGDSVPFTLAEYDGDFEQLSGDGPFDCVAIYPLVPRLPITIGIAAEKPLLALQVTVFPHHGFSIGVVMQHAAADGWSHIHFLKSWASVCKTGYASPPCYDRTVLVRSGGLYTLMTDAVLNMKPEQPSGLPTRSDKILATFTLGRDHIQRLKQRVAAGAPSLHCSTFVVSCAFVWVSLIKTRGFAGNQSAHFIFNADCRGRLPTPVSESYFGNCVAPCHVEVSAGDLAGEHDGVLAACRAIGGAIEEFKEIGLKDVEAWISKTQYITPDQDPLGILGSPRFRVYDTDFGWGTPRKVVVPSIAKGGNCISLLESRDGEGGVEIGLALPKNEMDIFQTNFSSALELL